MSFRSPPFYSKNGERAHPGSNIILAARRYKTDEWTKLCLEMDSEDDELVRCVATELADLMAKLTTDLWEKTKKVKTTASIEAKKAAFLERNIIVRKGQRLETRWKKVTTKKNRKQCG